MLTKKLKPTTIKEYIEAAPVEIQSRLLQLHECITKAAPGAEEGQGSGRHRRRVDRARGARQGAQGHRERAARGLRASQARRRRAAALRGHQGRVPRLCHQAGRQRSHLHPDVRPQGRQRGDPQ